jgi:polyisoprenoid-binding protein YceI
MTTIPFTGSFTADPDHSSFQAQLRHMGVGSFRTGFTDVEARLETGPDGARLTGRARVGSIAITRPPEFRAHVVEGEDFFDGRDLAFESRRLEFSDDGTVIYPDLALIPARLEDLLGRLCHCCIRGSCVGSAYRGGQPWSTASGRSS